MKKPPTLAEKIIGGRPPASIANDPGTRLDLVEFREPLSGLAVEADDDGGPKIVRLVFGSQVLELERNPTLGGYFVKMAELPAGTPAPPDPDPADTVAIALAKNLKGERLVSAVAYAHCLVIDFKVSCLMVFADRVALVVARPNPATGETAPAC